MRLKTSCSSRQTINQEHGQKSWKRECVALRETTCRCNMWSNISKTSRSHRRRGGCASSHFNTRLYCAQNYRNISNSATWTQASASVCRHYCKHVKRLLKYKYPDFIFRILTHRHRRSEDAQPADSTRGTKYLQPAARTSNTTSCNHNMILIICRHWYSLSHTAGI